MKTGGVDTAALRVNHCAISAKFEVFITVSTLQLHHASED